MAHTILPQQLRLHIFLTYRLPILSYPDIHFPDYSSIASARASRAGTSVSFITPRSVTTSPFCLTSFISSTICFITLPADGAQLPFSMIATSRFCHAFIFR